MSTEIVTCKRVVSFMVFLGFMVHHMLRINITIAIVDMIPNGNHTNHSQSTVVHYGWNEEQRNDILGIFFWGYVLTQIPGGRLSETFGSKRVIGIGLFLASILTILTPVSCINYYWLLFTRFALGLSMGIHWPSTPPMATKWASSKDASVFTSHMMACCLGAALTLSTGGYIIAYLGWPSVFYVTGGISLLWSLCWFYFVYDSPEQHPRISKKEVESLKIEIGVDNRVTKSTKTPWKKILSSGPVWALITGNTCATFTIYIVLFQLPIYIDHVLNLNIKENGWLSSTPYIARYVVAIISSHAADHTLKSGRFSTTAIRKFLNSTSYCGTAVLFTFQVFWGYNYSVCAVVFVGSFAFLGLVSPGLLANFVDISPAYCGTILALTHLPVSVSGYISTKIVAFFTKEKQTFEQWVYIFWIVVCVNVVACVICLIFTSGEVQSWNFKSNDIETNDEQSESLTNNFPSK